MPSAPRHTALCIASSNMTFMTLGCGDVSRGTVSVTSVPRRSRPRCRAAGMARSRRSRVAFANKPLTRLGNPFEYPLNDPETICARACLNAAIFRRIHSPRNGARNRRFRAFPASVPPRPFSLDCANRRRGADFGARFTTPQHPVQTPGIARFLHSSRVQPPSAGLGIVSVVSQDQEETDPIPSIKTD